MAALRQDGAKGTGLASAVSLFLWRRPSHARFFSLPWPPTDRLVRTESGQKTAREEGTAGSHGTVPGRERSIRRAVPCTPSHRPSASICHRSASADGAMRGRALPALHSAPCPCVCACGPWIPGYAYSVLLWIMAHTYTYDQPAISRKAMQRPAVMVGRPFLQAWCWHWNSNPQHQVA